MTVPLQATFPFNSPSGQIDITVDTTSREWCVQLIAPPSAPLAVLAVLYAAAVTWCNERDGYRAAIVGDTVLIAVPLHEDWGRSELGAFLDAFNSVLLQAGRPTLRITGTYGTLAYYAASDRLPRDVIRVFAAGDPESQKQLFEGVANWARHYNHGYPEQVNCVRENGIISITAQSGGKIDEADALRSLDDHLAPGRYRMARASAAPAPIPEEAEPTPIQPPRIPEEEDGGEEPQPATAV